MVLWLNIYWMAWPVLFSWEVVKEAEAPKTFSLKTCYVLWEFKRFKTDEPLFLLLSVLKRNSVTDTMDSQTCDVRLGCPCWENLHLSFSCIFLRMVLRSLIKRSLIARKFLLLLSDVLHDHSACLHPMTLFKEQNLKNKIQPVEVDWTLYIFAPFIFVCAFSIWDNEPSSSNSPMLYTKQDKQT